LGAIVDIEQLTSLVIKSQLIDRNECERLAVAWRDVTDEWNRKFEASSGESFCDFLVATNRLTRWQADKLLKGKWKGFQVSQFVILERMAKGATDTTYKALDKNDSNPVSLVITPDSTMPGGFSYQVRPYFE
jgi:hypothetical protein